MIFESIESFLVSERSVRALRYEIERIFSCYISYLFFLGGKGAFRGARGVGSHTCTYDSHKPKSSCIVTGNILINRQ